MSKDNWHKTDYGKQREFGELKRIKEQVHNAEDIIIDDNELGKITILNTVYFGKDAYLLDMEIYYEKTSNYGFYREWL